MPQLIDNIMHSDEAQEFLKLVLLKSNPKYYALLDYALENKLQSGLNRQTLKALLATERRFRNLDLFLTWLVGGLGIYGMINRATRDAPTINLCDTKWTTHSVTDVLGYKTFLEMFAGSLFLLKNHCTYRAQAHIHSADELSMAMSQLMNAISHAIEEHEVSIIDFTPSETCINGARTMLSAVHITAGGASVTDSFLRMYRRSSFTHPGQTFRAMFEALKGVFGKNESNRNNIATYCQKLPIAPWILALTKVVGYYLPLITKPINTILSYYRGQALLDRHDQQQKRLDDNTNSLSEEEAEALTDTVLAILSQENYRMRAEFMINVDDLEARLEPIDIADSRIFRKAEEQRTTYEEMGWLSYLGAKATACMGCFSRPRRTFGGIFCCFAQDGVQPAGVDMDDMDDDHIEGIDNADYTYSFESHVRQDQHTANDQLDGSEDYYSDDNNVSPNAVNPACLRANSSSSSWVERSRSNNGCGLTV